MEIVQQEIPEVLLIKPRVIFDYRGFFTETFSIRSFPQEIKFVLDNLSYSYNGTLRGLHLQHPNDQGKLVMAITGCIWDVAVDVRIGSPTFGRYCATELNSQNKYQFYVPPGFAHGFCVLSDSAHVLYKCTNVYEKSCEMSISFRDPDLNIPWPIENPLLSSKDSEAPFLKDIKNLPVYKEIF